MHFILNLLKLSENRVALLRILTLFVLNNSTGNGKCIEIGELYLQLNLN